MGIDIGKKIKEIRTERGMTLKELGEKTNLSTGFLSQLERGLTTIAVDSLEEISKVLDINLASFFNVSIKRNKPILRNYEKEVFSVKESGFIDYILSNDLTDKNILPRLIEVLPRSEDKDIEIYKHNGEEFIYILEGVLTLYIDNEKYDLYPGDSAHINSNIGHNWVNYTNRMVKFIAIHTPNKFKSSEK